MNPKPNLNLDQFGKWHEIVNDNIQHFFSTIPEEMSIKLDYSMESLSVLGSWLVERYPHFDLENPFDGQNEIHRGVVYYVGEVYRKYLEGHWNVHFKELEPDYEYGEEPVIEGFHHDVAICPYLEVLGTLADKDAKALLKVLQAFMHMYRSKKNLPTNKIT